MLVGELHAKDSEGTCDNSPATSVARRRDFLSLLSLERQGHEFAGNPCCTFVDVHWSNRSEKWRALNSCAEAAAKLCEVRQVAASEATALKLSFPNQIRKSKLLISLSDAQT